MRRLTAVSLSLSLFLSLTVAAAAPEKDAAVIWVDFDFKSIPEPKTRKTGEFETVFNSQMAERWKRATDIPKWVRRAADAPKQAPNVNALDEVPDSSWYTNRHALRHMTPEQLTQGPNRKAPPDFSHATIVKAKLQGVTPGLQLTDNNGTDYMIKFDNKDYPELQSGAELISTKILYASGYNVPENYIAYLNPQNLEIKPGLEMGKGKSKHTFNQQDLEKMLQNAARRSDGTYRVLASKIIEGKAKGPFSYIGIRSDDPNDVIPHEHRRELRGLRVIASWLNHWDLKEQNTLDVYVDESGHRFLRHYLIDFGSSLGGGRSPLEYFHGREYAIDPGSLFKELFTLGIYKSPDEKSAPVVFPEVGIFSAKDFDPGDWKPSFPVMPFDNMTREDAFWATRVILSFSESDLATIIKTAEYSNPKVAEYVLRTLLERRRIIAAYWLKDVNPIGNFSVDGTGGEAQLRFEDFMVDHDLAGAAEYAYEITAAASTKSDASTERGTTRSPRIPFTLRPGAETRITVFTKRHSTSSDPVTVSLRQAEGAYRILRIARS